jgi:hypothetical protein
LRQKSRKSIREKFTQYFIDSKFCRLNYSHLFCLEAEVV